MYLSNDIDSRLSDNNSIFITIITIMTDYRTILQLYVDSKIDDDMKSFSCMEDLQKYIISFKEFNEIVLNEDYCQSMKQKLKSTTSYQDQLTIYNEVGGQLWTVLLALTEWIRQMRPLNPESNQDKRVAEPVLCIPIPELSYSNPEKPQLIPIYTCVDESQKILSCIGLYCPRQEEFYRLNTYLCNSKRPAFEEIPPNFDMIEYSLQSTHGAGGEPLHSFIMIQTGVKNIMRAEPIEFY